MDTMGIKDEFLQELLFSKIGEQPNKTRIGFEDFLFFLTIFVKGTAEQKLKCKIIAIPSFKNLKNQKFISKLFKIKVAFNLYDIDGDGYINRQEMNKVAKSLCKLSGSLTTFSGEVYEDPIEFVDDYFERMDLDGDGRISYHDFHEGSLKNSDVLQAGFSMEELQK